MCYKKRRLFKTINNSSVNIAQYNNENVIAPRVTTSKNFKNE